MTVLSSMCRIKLRKLAKHWSWAPCQRRTPLSSQDEVYVRYQWHRLLDMEHWRCIALNITSIRVELGKKSEIMYHLAVLLEFPELYRHHRSRRFQETDEVHYPNLNGGIVDRPTDIQELPASLETLNEKNQQKDEYMCVQIKFMTILGGLMLFQIPNLRRIIK